MILSLINYNCTIFKLKGSHNEIRKNIYKKI